MENKANLYSDSKETPKNNEWDMSDAKNALYGTAASVSGTENVPENEDLPEAVEDYATFIAAQGEITLLNSRNIQRILAGSELHDDLEDDLGIKEGVCFDSNDDWNYNEHLWIEVEAAERARTLEKARLEELAENLDKDRSLKSMARAAKYIFNKLEMPGSLRLVDKKHFLKNASEADAGIILGVQSAFLNHNMDYVTQITLNLEELRKEGYSGWEILGIIGHEVWHGHQKSQIYNLLKGDLSNNTSERQRAILYLFNDLHYINPEVDFEAYQYQLVESEAESFAQEIKIAQARDWDEFDADERYGILMRADNEDEGYYYDEDSYNEELYDDEKSPER